ncbi:MAG: CocE/NonD family hydrolase [Armatimonadota bacterium]
MSKWSLSPLVGSALIAVAALPSHAQTVRDRYRKVEHRIPMRDGRTLYTALYIPRSIPAGTKPAILLERTPYGAGPYGPDEFRGAIRGGAALHDGRFIFAFQDVRGKGASQGTFANVRPLLLTEPGPGDIDEATDTWDSVDWLVRNVPEANGRVGLWGISYPGFYAGAGAVGTHPALRAASPQAPVSDWFVGDDFHHNGALMLMDAVRFATFGETAPSGAGFGFTLPGNDDAFANFLELGTIKRITERFFAKTDGLWRDFVSHPDYDDFWQARALPPRMRGVKCAMLTVGGWYDAEDCWGALNLYKATEARNPGIVNTLVMGPWTHGMWAGRDGSRLGDARFGANTSATFQDTIEAPFFRKFLLGEGSGAEPEARMFETGGNAWRTFGAWPPREARDRRWALTAGRGVSFSDAGPSGVLRYRSDPAKPVPHEPGRIATRTTTYPVADQRFLRERSDVLTFVSEPLERDIVVAGPIDIDAKVRISTTDVDLVAKVVDVFPEDAEGEDAGDWRLVRGEVMRARYRKGYTNPVPMGAGKWEQVSFSLPDVLHRFRKGHRVAVQVQSTWFPLVDRNPQQFVNIYRAEPSDFVPTDVELSVGGMEGTALRVRVLGER